jgi:hypothetical protein
VPLTHPCRLTSGPLLPCSSSPGFLARLVTTVVRSLRAGADRSLMGTSPRDHITRAPPIYLALTSRSNRKRRAIDVQREEMPPRTDRVHTVVGASRAGQGVSPKKIGDRRWWNCSTLVGSVAELLSTMGRTPDCEIHSKQALSSSLSFTLSFAPV